MAIERGSVNAMYNLGHFYFEINDLENMFKYYLMAVELGEEDPKVNLDHFVRLFVNHRSVFDIERTNFEEVGHGVLLCSSVVVTL